MRGRLGPVIALSLALAGCGDSSDPTEPAPRDQPSTEAVTTPPDVVTDEPAPTPPPAPTSTPTTPTTTTATAPVGPSEAPPPVAEAAIYGEPVDLGVLPGGSTSLANDINNHGIVVGFSFVGTVGHDAVWWPDGMAGPQRLDHLYELRFDDQSSLAMEINDAGQILVSAMPQAFVVDPGRSSSMEILPPFDEHGFSVSDMNDRGQVVGHGIIEWPPCDDCEPPPITRGFVWDPGTGDTTIIAPLDGATSSSANGINDDGWVVGSSDGRPFVWDPNDPIPRELTTLPSHEWAYAYDLNDDGVAVGVSGGEAAMWDTTTGEVLDLGGLAPEVGHGVANGINDAGQVVLMADGNNWVLDRSTNRISQVPGTCCGYGISINDVGQAVGMASERAALWNPIPEVSAPELVLRPDGLGTFDFGDPANELLDELTAAFGPPTDQFVETAEPPGPFDFLPGGYHAAFEIQFVEWSDPDLGVILSDTPFFGDHLGEPVPGTLHLTTWETTDDDLRLDSGVGVGSPLSALRSRYPDVGVGTSNVCGTDYDPAAFVTAPFTAEAPAFWLGVRGALDWDWVRDLQSALNQRGATLDVDGTYGPATTDAVLEFQQAQGIDEGTAPDANGLVGPRTISALGLEAPDNARITRLAAGHPGTC